MPRSRGIVGAEPAAAASSGDPPMSGLDLYLSQETLAYMLLYGALVGFGLGVVYDVLRILRILCGDSIVREREGQGSRKKRPWPLSFLLFLEDVIFSLIAALALILLCYYTNDGQLRAPAVVGMAGGFLVYLQTVGRPVVRLAEGLAALLRRFLWLCLYLLLLPLKGLGRLTAFLWSLGPGRWIQSHRERVTEKEIRALTEAAAHGFYAETAAKLPEKKKE